MAPTLAKPTSVYFLAEAPGRHEDEESGRPLTGLSGSILRECIPEAWEAECSFDNVVRDRPPQNRTPTWNEIECCRSYVTASIEKAKPKLIVGLGGIALSWMLNSTDLAGMRGRAFAVKVGNHECWFMPTYHPSFISRIAHNKKQPLRSKLGHCFKMDIKRAFRLVDELPEAKVDDPSLIRSDIHCFDGSKPGHYKEVLQLLDEADRAAVKAVDLETNGLRPYGKDSAIMTAALSFKSTHFAFAVDHPKAKWSLDQKTEILKSLEVVLVGGEGATLIAHNAPFELEWFADLFGPKVVKHGLWEDTMVQAHILDERRGKQAHGKDDENRRAVYQSLDFLCKQHFGIAFKGMFKLNKKNMAKADLGETLIYNGVDTKYTLKLWHRQKKLLIEQGLFDAYHEALPRQPAVALMQHFGIDVDQVEVKACQKKLKKEIDTLTADINNLKVVKAYIKDHKEFNPASNDDVLAIFRDYLKRPEVKVSAEIQAIKGKGEFSVDKNVLDQIDHPLAGLIIDLRNRAKLKATYVDCLELNIGSVIWPDGKIHTSFNTTFAETGRTSSDEPNMQNYPQRQDAWVRKQIVAPEGYILVAFDYGQLEACTAAMCSKDKYLVQALWDDYDIHMEWAEKLAKRYPAAVTEGDLSDKKNKKAFRSRIKNKLVFPAIFGAQNESIARYLDIPVEPVDDLMDEFWETFHGLKKWQDRLMAAYYDDGFVESPTGRRHRYPLTRNQAINFPIQNFACDIVCTAMNKLSYISARTGQWHLHPRLNIHDDLTFVIPDDENILTDSIEQIYRSMLSPTYKEINVPLSVTCSIGKRWYGMQEIGKFWSNKDL